MKQKIIRYIESLNEGQLKLLDKLIQEKLEDFETLQIQNRQSTAKNFGLNPEQSEFYSKIIGAD